MDTLDSLQPCRGRCQGPWMLAVSSTPELPTYRHEDQPLFLFLSFPKCVEHFREFLLLKPEKS